MTLALSKYEHMCTKYKWLSKSYEEQHVVSLYAELEKMNNTSLKLENFFKPKVTPKGKTKNQVNQNRTRKSPQNRIITKSMLGRKSLPNKAKRILN